MISHNSYVNEFNNLFITEPCAVLKLRLAEAVLLAELARPVLTRCLLRLQKTQTLQGGGHELGAEKGFGIFDLFRLVPIVGGPEQLNGVNLEGFAEGLSDEVLQNLIKLVLAPAVKFSIHYSMIEFMPLLGHESVPVANSHPVFS